MLYTIEETAQKGQVLLISTDKRGVCPIVSLQMPEQRAKQIVSALAIVECLAYMSDTYIEMMAATNIEATLKQLRDNCLKNLQIPIEKS